MNILLAAALLLTQITPQQAYLLDHPIDPDLLIIATQDGRYPIALLAGTDCSWVHSDMNVIVSGQGQHAWQLIDGTSVCNVVVSDRVDPTPCLSNDAGDCDIEMEHQWT